ncbi:hypothetical protein ACHAXA_004402 [Cyclostephanos tholiformis]|uniref:Uncharacterized protein n=1 Tax=Cyclostephanos tholiformis TaxID=382380 RepID=A0ABD3REP6_9STRA
MQTNKTVLSEMPKRSAGTVSERGIKTGWGGEEKRWKKKKSIVEESKVKHAPTSATNKTNATMLTQIHKNNGELSDMQTKAEVESKILERRTQSVVLDGGIEMKGRNEKRWSGKKNSKSVTIVKGTKIKHAPTTTTKRNDAKNLLTRLKWKNQHTLKDASVENKTPEEKPFPLENLPPLLAKEGAKSQTSFSMPFRPPRSLDL